MSKEKAEYRGEDTKYIAFIDFEDTIPAPVALINSTGETIMEYSPQDYAKVIEHLGRILAANARILGMQAENMQRQAVNSSMAYVESDFAYETDNIEVSVDYLKNWG